MESLNYWLGSNRRGGKPIDYITEYVGLLATQNSPSINTKNVTIASSMYCFWRLKTKGRFFGKHLFSQGSHSNWKSGKMGRHFLVWEKSGNFEQTEKVSEKSGKITQNTGKLKRISEKFYLLFLVIFKWTVYYLLKWIKFSVKKIKH